MYRIDSIKRHVSILGLIIIALVFLGTMRSCEVLPTSKLNEAFLKKELAELDGTWNQNETRLAIESEIESNYKAIQKYSIFKKISYFFLFGICAFLLASISVFAYSYIDWIKEKSEIVISAIFISCFILASFIFSSALQAREMESSPTATGLIEYYEGTYLKSYKDPIGIWTIGTGTIRIAGKNVKEGMQISKLKAEYLLKKDMRRFEKYVNLTIKRELIQYEYDALISFTYNLGYRLKNRLLRWINTKETDKVVWLINKYINAAGRPLRGLIKRRASEGKVYKGHCPTILKFNRNYCCE